jgi:hypothetical protein
VPAQQRANRKPKRPFATAAQPAQPAEELFEPNFADEPLVAGGGSAYVGRGPVDTTPRPRAGRRLEMLRGGGQEAVTARVAPGQLPTYDRGYLHDELKRITVISVGLLVLILVLTLVLR